MLHEIRNITDYYHIISLKIISMKVLRIYIIIMFLFPGCKREDIPAVITSDVTSITRTSAICGGDVVSQGDSEVTAKGICWSITENPTVMDSITVDSFGLGSFTSELTELDPGTEYYVRAYATNSYGTGYGETKSFSTQPPSLPELITYYPSPIRCTSARSGGEITCNGGSPVIDCGICWGTSENPTLSDNYISAGIEVSTFKITIIGLESNTDYYVRAYATNSIGTGYGENKLFTTCLDINSNPVNPITMTLYDKPLDTIRKYIRGKWQIVVIKGGMAYETICFNNYFSEFTPDDRFITNTFRTEIDTYLIDWVRRYYDMGDSTYRMELKKVNDDTNIVGRYFIREILYDSLIYHEIWDDALYYYGIKEQ
jgi:hypothetical protein